MSALWAIVVDTWRQSRQQVVFIIMVGLLWLLALGAVAVAQPVEVQDEDGVVREHLSVAGIEHSHEFLEGQWAATFALSVMFSYEGDEPPDPFGETGQAMQAELVEMEAVIAQTSALQRGTESMVVTVASLAFTLSMLLFIAAASGYFPGMLEAGAIDIVLAKPLPRWKIFLGKYLGGLALYVVAIVSTHILLFIGLGLRTGVWVDAIALVLPLQIFAAATAFALLSLVGVVSRSTSLCMITGFVYYLVIDSIVTGLKMFPFQVEWMRSVQKLLRATVPNFDSLKQAATYSVINMPAVDWQAIDVAAAWLVISLGLGYAKFHRTDY